MEYMYQSLVYTTMLFVILHLHLQKLRLPMKKLRFYAWVLCIITLISIPFNAIEGQSPPSQVELEIYRDPDNLTIFIRDDVGRLNLENFRFQDANGQDYFLHDYSQLRLAIKTVDTPACIQLQRQGTTGGRLEDCPNDPSRNLLQPTILNNSVFWHDKTTGVSPIFLVYNDELNSGEYQGLCPANASRCPITYQLTPSQPPVVNQPPVLEPIAPQSCTVGDVLALPINVSDPNGDMVTVSVQSNNPSIAAGILDENEPTLHVVCGESGSGTITLVADDGRGGVASTSFFVVVNSEIVPNQNPILEPFDNQICRVGESLTLPISVSDPDSDNVVVVAASNAPSVASASTNTSRILTLQCLRAGSATITVQADDGLSGIATASFTVSIEEAPTPTLSPTAPPDNIAPLSSLDSPIPPLFTEQLQRGNLVSVSWSKFNDQIAIGMQVGFIGIFDYDSTANTLTPVNNPFSAHSAGENVVLWANNRNLLASGGPDSVVRLWGFDSSNPTLVALPIHFNAVTALAWSRSHVLVSSGTDGRIIASTQNNERWERTGEPFATNTVSALAWNPNQYEVVSGGYDGVVRKWERNGNNNLVGAHPNTAVTGVAWTTKGVIFSVGLDGRFMAWTQPDTTIARQLNAPSDLALSPDESLIAVATGDYVYVWDTQTYILVAMLDPRLNPEVDYVVDIDWNQAGNRLVGVSNKGVAIVWEVPPTAPTRITQQKPIRSGFSTIRDFAWSPTGSQIAALSDEDSLIIWNADGSPVSSLPLQAFHQTHQTQAVAWHPNGGQIAVGGCDRVVSVWDVASGQAKATFIIDQWCVTDMAFTPSGDAIIAVDAGARLYRIPMNGDPIKIEAAHSLDINDLDWASPSFATVSDDGSVRVWQISGSDFVRLHDGIGQISGSGPINSVAWLVSTSHGRDGSLATGYTSGDLRIWSLPIINQYDPPHLQGHTSPIVGVSWTANRSRLVSIDTNCIYLWNTAIHTRLVINICDSGINYQGVEWNRQGDAFAVGTSFGELKLWGAP